jgi:hypothetical protein
MKIFSWCYTIELITKENHTTIYGVYDNKTVAKINYEIVKEKIDNSAFENAYGVVLKAWINGNEELYLLDEYKK